MNEVGRVLLSRKTLIFFALALLLNCIFFAYECSEEKAITLQGDELTAYLESYPAFLQNISDNASDLDAISILQGQNSFSMRNIEKTAQDYAALSGEVSFGENRGVVVFSNYITSDFILIVAIIYVVTLFTEEKRKGLHYLICSTKNGRFQLALWRVVIVSAVSVIVSLTLTLTSVATASVVYGDMGLLRSIQSVPEFMKCSLPITIFDYILFSAFLKALAAAIIGLIFWLFSALFESVAAAVGSALILGTQYLLYALIIPTDALNGFKYCNVFALLNNDVLYKNYCNLNVFGRPVGFALMATVFGIAMFVLAAVLCVLSASGKVMLSGNSGSIFTLLSKAISRKSPQLPLFLWEAKKALIDRKGLIIIAAVICLAVSSTMQYTYTGDIDVEFGKLYKKYSGTVTEEMVDGINAELDAMEQEWYRLHAEFQEMEKNGASENDLKRMAYKLQTLAFDVSMLDKFVEKAEDCWAYTCDTGISVEIINQNVYDLLLSGDRQTTSKNSLYVLLALIAAFGGIMASEKQSNMTNTLKSSKRGRLCLTANKVILVLVVCIILSLSVNMAQLWQIAEGMEFNNLDAPCQSVEMLRGIHFELSLKEYLVLLYIVRVLCTCAVGMIIMLISSLFDSSIVAIGASAVLLLVPSVLNSAGLKFIPSFTGLIGIVIK